MLRAISVVKRVGPGVKWRNGVIRIFFMSQIQKICCHLANKMTELLILRRRFCWCPAADVLVFSSGKSPGTITTMKGNLLCIY